MKFENKLTFGKLKGFVFIVLIMAYISPSDNQVCRKNTYCDLKFKSFSKVVFLADLIWALVLVDSILSGFHEIELIPNRLYDDTKVHANVQICFSNFDLNRKSKKKKIETQSA